MWILPKSFSEKKSMSYLSCSRLRKRRKPRIFFLIFRLLLSQAGGESGGQRAHGAARRRCMRGGVCPRHPPEVSAAWPRDAIKRNDNTATAAAPLRWTDGTGHGPTRGTPHRSGVRCPPLARCCTGFKLFTNSDLWTAAKEGHDSDEALPENETGARQRRLKHASWSCTLIFNGLVFYILTRNSDLHYREIWCVCGWGVLIKDFLTPLKHADQANLVPRVA